MYARLPCTRISDERTERMRSFPGRRTPMSQLTGPAETDQSISAQSADSHQPIHPLWPLRRRGSFHWTYTSQPGLETYLPASYPWLAELRRCIGALSAALVRQRVDSRYHLMAGKPTIWTDPMRVEKHRYSTPHSPLLRKSRPRLFLKTFAESWRFRG